MREWKISLERYGISRYMYDEMLAKCRQYPENKLKLDAIRGGMNDLRRDGMPHGSGKSDPTAEHAILADKAGQDVEAIDKAMQEACEPGMRHWLMLNVMYGMRWERMAAPIGRRQFYERRRAFFVRLAVHLGMIEG